MKKLFTLIISLLSAQVIFAQCFSSTGNPIGGNANMGVSNKNVLRLASFYKHAYSGRYFHGDELSIDEGHITADHAVYNYVSLMSSYGITNKLTAEVSTGYYLNKTKEFETPMTGKGFSNAVVSAKYAVYKNPVKRFEITAKVGAKIPLRQSEQKLETSTIDISKHPDVQSCLGNY
ncbi:MAG TPA: hypothetical protein VJ946_03055, partial [Bacteroidales bacterium]|nr:hypothetical protein [Bacteroidales bacterium]